MAIFECFELFKKILTSYSFKFSVVLLTFLTVETESSKLYAQFDIVDNLVPNLTSKNHGDTFIQADNLEFDSERNTILAMGNVKIRYGGFELSADLISLDKESSRLIAEGNIELVSQDGSVINAKSLDLSDDFSEGFIQILEITAVNRTKIYAEKAEKIDEQIMTFENAIYSTYYNVSKEFPSLWRLRAVRVTQDKSLEIIVFEDVRVEVFGLPLAYLPKFAISDPQTYQNSGFLRPSYLYDDKLGLGFGIPYYYAIAPDYDTTLTASIMSRQGALFGWEWRQLLTAGSYSLHAAGIHQFNPDAFEFKSSDRTYRGAVKTNGEIQIDKFWKFGWNYGILSDRKFPSDYNSVGVGHYGNDPRLFLRGEFHQNYFDASFSQFREKREAYDDEYRVSPSEPVKSKRIDPQDFQPLIHPVVDHKYIFDRQLIGGELSFTNNLTSLTRNLTDILIRDDQFFYRGYAGTHNRFSMKSDWHRKYVDSFGQLFTPFAYMQLDFFLFSQLEHDMLEITDNTIEFRGIPAIGINYQYPFVSTHSWGNQIIEPIGQLVVRPSETAIGEIPNNDSLSLVFETSNLFEYDKYSGFDRVEGGTRLNYGFRHLLQFQNGTVLNSVFGQSVQIAGLNSFDVSDRTNAFTKSSLENEISDFLATNYLDTSQGLQFRTSNWLNNGDFVLNRNETQASGFAGPVSASIQYSYFRDNEEYDIGVNRQEGQASIGLKLHENWRTYGSVRYDFEKDVMFRNTFGIGYEDDGISMSVTYGEINDRNSREMVDQYVKFNINPRTLGEINVRQLNTLGLFDYEIFN